MKYRWLVNTIKTLVVVGIVVIAFWLLYGEKWYNEYKDSEHAVGEHAPISLSTWMVDWDWAASKEDVAVLNDQWESVQLFLGYFDEKDQVIWNDDIKSKASEAKAMLENEQSPSNTKLYLTIVNDVIDNNGGSIQKDGALVDRIIASAETQYRYVEQFVSLIHESDFDGLELDFENINDESWPELISFYTLLHRRLSAESIPLRIVLEPKVDYRKLQFPEGPQYVVMAYNLFGYHSEAGPKADRLFISKLTAKMEALPGEPIVAIATGGFDWSEAGQVTAITEQEATLLAEKAKSGSIKRDEQSGAMTFSYVDEHGAEHTVWYGDGETLAQWIDMIQQRGYSNIAVWRMGNLADDSLTKLQQIVNKKM